MHRRAMLQSSSASTLPPKQFAAVFSPSAARFAKVETLLSDPLLCGCWAVAPEPTVTVTVELPWGPSIQWLLLFPCTIFVFHFIIVAAIILEYMTQIIYEYT